MGSDSEKASRKPRADSQRNRERVLAAAREVFSRGGPEASLEAVARTAGVGIGTLYRHFPTREALFQAVYKREVDQLVELADELLGEGSPFAGLRKWLHANVGMVATKRGMLTALAPAGPGSELYAASSARLAGSVGKLIAAAIEAGQMRDDISPEEVMRALYGICYMPQQPGWQDTVLRLLDVFVDGLALRPEAGT